MFESKGTELSPTRTKQSYQNSVSVSEGQEVCDGVKFDSVFNCLKHIHVCDPGLPPSMAHDLFEGVVSVDLALYIKQLVTVGKHFSYVQLNRNITSFKYSGSDLNNKPCEVKPDGSKLT